MAEIAASLVKELRFKSGAGIMECKEALTASNGDIEGAIKWLRERGKATAAKKASRVAKEGLVYAYIHPGSKLGVLVEVNCETDFVARNQEFQQLVKDIAMHVAASNPASITRDEVPAQLIEAEKDIYRKQAEGSGKPAQVIEKIIEGRMDKFYSQVCLLEQPFIKDMNITVREYVQEVIAKTGENIVVRRFTRYQLGQE